MAPGILYTYPENFRAYKALIAAQFSGAQIKIAEDFVFGETNKTEAFLKKFPLGKIPAFETSDGKYLTESNAIAYHVSNDELKGKNDLEKAQVIQWFGFADSEILPASCAWVFPLLGIMPFNKKTVDNAKEDVTKVLTFLNTHLLSRTYLVGERITLADISVAMTMLHLFQHVLDEKARKTYQNVTRWFKTIINQPQSIAVLGQFKLADAVLEFDAKKFAQDKPKKAAPAAKAPAEKKQAKAKKSEEADDVDMEIAQPPSKDPWEALPKGKFDFDDFKRFYSNQDVDKSIPYFWDKFDPESHSIWYCEYKYNDELTKTFMSCNLIGGMYQRIEKMRKAAFASMCLFGGDNDSTISGVWVWRGQDLAFTLSPDWQIDYETYSWKKLDPKDAETKRLVQLYFSWVGTDKDGRKFTEGKIFK